jgi:hypothetical protein
MELDVSRDVLAACRRGEMWAGVARIGRGLACHSAARSGGLLAVGSSHYEPWHLVAHLRDAVEWNGETVAPTLVRWQVPPGAPAHLGVGLDRIAQAGRSETVLVIAPDVASDALLERLADARRHGSTVLALAGMDSAHAALHELEGLVHDLAVVEPARLEGAEHVLPLAASGALDRAMRRAPWPIRSRRLAPVVAR